MTAVVLALSQATAAPLAVGLEQHGIQVLAVVNTPSEARPWLDEADALLLPATRAALSPALLTACDRAAVRIVPLGEGESRHLQRLGLPAALPLDVDPATLAALVLAEDPLRTHVLPSARSAQIIAVWGTQGSPGRTTTAVQLAVELRRQGGRCVLLDADTVSPSVALTLGLDEDAPGLAAACRRAELGGIDAAELTRLSTVFSCSAGDIDVLSGLNRPSRWPELSASRLRGTLAACRSWADHTVVDVAASFEADEEITNDRLSGPRRHAATTAVLADADIVIALTSADPVSIARFVREHAELRRLIGPRAHIQVVINRTRPGPLGVDPRGQIRRSLERFAGISDPFFLPFDMRAADAALLQARPMADVTPRAPFVAAVRRLATKLSGAAPIDDKRRGSSRAVRRPRKERAVREA